MNVKEIVTEYLTANGFDGLYDPTDECGCKIYDLMPCIHYQDKCSAGYLYKDDHGGNWVIGSKEGA